MARTTGRRSLADLIRDERLRPGQRLIIRRRSHAPVHGCLEEDGSILVDGQVFDTPSAAARHALSARTADGWARWRLADREEWTLDDVRRANGSFPTEAPGSELGLTVDDLGGEAFGTVLADPPWRFTNRTGKVAPEHRRLSRYDTMSVDEICALPVAGVMADQAHCYLWVPNALLADGMRVLEAWGFTYKTMLIWHKVRKDGGSDGRGVGFYFRNVTEPVLFGVRGRLRTLPPGRRQVNYLATRKREHSRKPDELYDIVEECSPGPFLELFARYPQPGWAVWGNEADPDIVPKGRRYAAYGGGAEAAAVPLDG